MTIINYCLGPFCAVFDVVVDLVVMGGCHVLDAST